MLSQQILEEWAAVFSNPFLFLIFVSEERASEIIESKIQSLFQRGAEASSSLKRNKRGGSPQGVLVYAGFEPELAGAERHREPKRGKAGGGER